MKEYVVGIINNGNLSTYLPDKNPTQKDKDANHS
jgi:hypothetical protein